MPRRALIVGAGGLNGAYGAGVLATLARSLPPEYFDAVYASSVGVYAATFFIAQQPDIIEHVWRNLVDGRKLVGWLKPLYGRRALDLDYLDGIFKTHEVAKLKVAAVFLNKTELVYVLTNFKTGEATYMTPSPDNIFECMKASVSFPFINKPVPIEENLFIDGTLSDALPVKKALKDGYKELIVVSNKPRGIYAGKYYRLTRVICPFVLPKEICRLVATYQERQERIYIPPTTKVINPKIKLPLRHAGDTNKKRINDTFDLGTRDAYNFLRTI